MGRSSKGPEGDMGRDSPPMRSMRRLQSPDLVELTAHPFRRDSSPSRVGGSCLVRCNGLLFLLCSR